MPNQLKYLLLLFSSSLLNTFSNSQTLCEYCSFVVVEIIIIKIKRCEIISVTLAMPFAFVIDHISDTYTLD